MRNRRSPLQSNRQERFFLPAVSLKCGLRLWACSGLVGFATVAIAQKPVPIPSFDSPAVQSPAAPPALGAAQIAPAAGSAVVLPAASPAKEPAPEIPAFQQPPTKAVVNLDSSGLVIRAKNSSLAQILRDLASSSGMKVEGFSRDERVFGNFGPDDPHQVLSALLDGSGYNVIMVGDSDKRMPRLLSLSARSKPGQPDVAPETPPPTLAASDEDGEQMTDDPPDAPDTPIPAPPPSIQVTPADAAQSQPTSENADNPSVRTPQQILEELQRLHPDQAAPSPQPPQADPNSK
jgi:hypothetical protein